MELTIRITFKTVILLLFSMCILLYGLLVFIGDNSTSNITVKYNCELPAEIQTILERTPYLWRKMLTDQDTVKSRIEAQQKWIQELSWTEYLKNHQKPKTILVADNLTLFYGTKQIICPYAPHFEDKCTLEPATFERNDSSGTLYYKGRDGAAFVTVRNHRIHSPYKVQNNDKTLEFIWIVEPPEIAVNVNIGEHNALLANYWKGSDIPVPYRIWNALQPGYNSTDVRSHVLQNSLKIALQNKTKMAVVAVSDCRDFAQKRMNYIAELQKYMEVDVYGKCGNLSCEGQECFEKFAAEYKFYLSFENSECEDYITEKFFDNGLGHYIVPVVLGARPRDYRTAAPPHSYIDVNDFESPAKLAEYLVSLSKDGERYKEYFKWKGTGTIHRTPTRDFFCRVCGMMYYADFVPPPKWEEKDKQITYKDLNKCVPKYVQGWRNVEP